MVMADLIVNHVSCTSRSLLTGWPGAETAYDGMFLTFGSVFPRGAREEDLLCLYRPRPGLPFTAYTLADGSKRLIWTTSPRSRSTSTSGSRSPGSTCSTS